MKKTVLSVLVVLLLSFVLFGCGDKACEICGEIGDACICQAKGASDLNKKAKDFVNGAAGNTTAADAILTPQGASLYDSWGSQADTDGPGTAYILWNNANQAMFDYYHAAWLRNRAAQNVENYYTGGGFTKIVIDFHPDSGAILTMTPPIQYPAGTIILTASAN